MEQEQRSHPSKENKNEGLGIKPVLSQENLEGSEHMSRKEPNEDDPVPKVKDDTYVGRSTDKEDSTNEGSSRQ